MNWKLNYKGQALVISSGLIYLNSKHPKGLYLQDILDMINKEPDKSYYSQETVKNIILHRAINDSELENIGKERKYYSSINLYNMEHEREFEELPLTGYELINRVYDSKPKKVS